MQFQQALEINPRYADASLNLGNALLQKGKVDEAADQYRKTVVLKPDYAMAHYNLGLALSQQGQMDAAMAEYKNALLINPGDAEFHLPPCQQQHFVARETAG